ARRCDLGGRRRDALELRRPLGAAAGRGSARPSAPEPGLEARLLARRPAPLPKEEGVEHHEQYVPGEQRPARPADRPELPVMEVPALRQRERSDEQRAGDESPERDERDQPDEVLR